MQYLLLKTFKKKKHNKTPEMGASPDVMLLSD